MTKARTNSQKRAGKRAQKRSAIVGGTAGSSPGPACRILPTPERMAKGQWVSGVQGRVYQDAHSTPLRRALDRPAPGKAPMTALKAFQSGKLTIEQVEAGEWFEGLYRALRGSPGPRSCLDFAPHGNSETESERRIRLEREWRQVLDRTAAEADVLVSVCIMHEPIGDRRSKYRRWRSLVAGLTILADLRGA